MTLCGVGAIDSIQQSGKRDGVMGLTRLPVFFFPYSHLSLIIVFIAVVLELASDARAIDILE